MTSHSAMTIPGNLNHVTCLLFVGDVMLGRLVDQIFPHFRSEDVENQNYISYLKHKRKDMFQKYHQMSYSFPWGNILPYFLQSDLRLINLETSITTHGIKWPRKAFNYRMHPKNTEALSVAKVDFCSLANNHILDYDIEGMRETIKVLRERGIGFAGAGENIEEAFKPCIIHHGDQLSLIIYSFSDHYSYWKASQTNPGINYVELSSEGWNPKNAKFIVNKLKEDIKARCSQPGRVWIKIISIHMGGNYAWLPTQNEQMFCKMLIDEAGIDVVHGHSSHHIKAVEIYKGKPIMYGCGDFIDDYAVDSEYRNDLGFIYQLFFDCEKMRFTKMELIPTEIALFQVNKARGTNREWLEEKMKKLCNLVGTTLEVNDEKCTINIKE